MKINITDYSKGITKPVCANPGFTRMIAFIFFFALFSISINAQDLLRLKSGKEIRVTVIEENSDVVRYREFENPSGPVYTITRDKIETIKYKKGGRETQQSKNKEPEIVTDQELSSSVNGYQQLTVKKRFVYSDGVRQNSRSVKTIMEDHPEAIRLYESGKKMCDMSNLCAVGVIVTSFTASQIANKQEEDADRKRISVIGLSIDGAFIITAIILSSSGKQKIRKSVSLYNSATGKPVTYNMSIGLQDNGIGVGFMF
ncbi:MAG TPA: hypothetical protein VMV47_08490 [Bacteroidales bacterium]|nr:hypothetical protein [Bacteroidales bacterium]